MFRKSLVARGGYGPKPGQPTWNQLRKEFERGPSTDKYFSRNKATGELQYKGFDVNDHRKWFWGLPGGGPASGALAIFPLSFIFRNQNPEKPLSPMDVIVAGKLKSESMFSENNIEVRETTTRSLGGFGHFVSTWPRRLLNADTRHNVNPKRYRAPWNQKPQFKRGSAQNDPRAHNFEGLLNESMRHVDAGFAKKYKDALREGLYGPSRTANAQKAKALAAGNKAAAANNNTTALIPAGDADDINQGACSPLNFVRQELPSSANRPFQVAGLPNPEAPVAPVAAQYGGWRSIKL